MKHATRTDIHRPSAFQSADYSIAGYIDIREETHIWNECARNCQGNPLNADLYRAEAAAQVAALHRQYKAWFGVEAAPSTCKHCGTGRCSYFAVALHTPTSEYVAIGHNCAENIGLPSDEHQWNRLQSRAEAIATARKRDAALAGFEATDPALFAALTLGHSLATQREAVTAKLAADFGVTCGDAVNQIRRSLNVIESITLRAREYAYVFASQKQKDLLVDAATFSKAKQWAVQNQERFDARQKAEAARLDSISSRPALAGRVEVTGTVASAKWVENTFGYQNVSALKGLLVTATGDKVWLTIPSKAYDNVEAIPHVVGKTLTVTVTIEPSKDAGFYFGSRPTFKALV